MTDEAPSLINLDTPLLLDLGVLCEPIPGMPTELQFTLPGGAVISTLTGALPPTPFQYACAALNLLNGVLAPLTPIFTIIETVTAIQKCLTVIPEIIGPPPNPQKLFEALEELSEKMLRLAKMMPIFSIPVLCVQMLDVIIQTIDSAASELTALARFSKQIQEAQFVSTQASGLTALIKCSQQSRDTQMTNIEKTFASINPLITLFNTFGAAAGLPAIPAFQSTWPEDPFEFAHTLQDVADALREVRSKIPL